MNKVDLIIKNIGELVTVAGNNKPRLGKEMEEVGIIKNGAIAVKDGKIIEVEKESNVLSSWESDKIIDAEGLVVTPGFVDPHTHPVFAITRENEFELRIKGASYEEIAAKGGGIRNSVRKLRECNKLDLKEKVRKRLDNFLKLGTTTIEAKSGYGLSTEDEIKSLEILSELNKEHPIDIVPTFLGAHEIPDEYRDKREAYIDLLVNEMIPEVSRKKLAVYCDIFCEENVFSVEESRKILKVAKENGLKIKMHADEFQPIGGAELAAELKAVSADHLVAISDEGIKAMSENSVMAILLPATTFFLGKQKYAPAKKMIEANVPVAISTDFNPGSSMTQSMTMVLCIASLYLRMLPSQSIVASTINSACAIGMADVVGSLEKDKKADFVIWDAKTYKYLPYYFGDNIAKIVVKSGEIVYKA